MDMTDAPERIWIEELVKELREYTETISCAGGSWYETPDICIQAADKLEELAAENEQQFQMLANQARTVKELQAALVEKDKENAALREALEDAMAGMRYVHQVYGDLVGVGFKRVEERGREALARNAGGKDAE